MELWGWLIGYVVLFALLHLVLYYVYVRREDGPSPSASLADGSQNHAGLQSSPRADRQRREDASLERDNQSLEAADFDGETTTCPHCGSLNEGDRTFTYCRVCVSPLRQ